jgi:hypothetical protein
MPPRRPNPAEWAQLSGSFPNLIWNDVWITAEPTAQYNCIGYSMGIYQWINPLSPLAAFQQQYAARGFVVAPPNTALIDGWGTNGGAQMTHGSRQSTSMPQTGLWESKLGQSFRITHGRIQLVSPLYGTVLTHFSPRGGAARKSEEVSMPQYSSEESARVADHVGQVSADLRAAFDERLAAWKATWARPDLAMSQSTYDRATGPEFEAVVGLGDGIVPLVVNEIMTKSDGFFLVPLLEEFTDPVPRGAEPVESEQSRGDRAIRAWLTRN